MTAVGCTGFIANRVIDTEKVFTSVDGVKLATRAVVAATTFIDRIITKVAELWAAFCEHLATMAQLLDFTCLITHVVKFIKNKFNTTAELLHNIFYAIFRFLRLIIFVEKFGLNKVIGIGDIAARLPGFGTVVHFLGVGVETFGILHQISQSHNMKARAQKNDWMCENIPSLLHEAYGSSSLFIDNSTVKYHLDKNPAARVFKDSEIQRITHNYSVERSELSMQNLTTRRWKLALTLTESILKITVFALLILGFFGVSIAGMSLALTGPLLVSVGLSVALVGLASIIVKIITEKKISEFQEAPAIIEFRKKHPKLAQLMTTQIEQTVAKYADAYDEKYKETGRPLASIENDTRDHLYNEDDNIGHKDDDSDEEIDDEATRINKRMATL